MTDTDRFFDEELKQIDLESNRAAHDAARELERDIQRQIRTNFNSPSLAFQRGVRVSEWDGGASVRLSPILSSHGLEREQQGNPNLWILLPEGQRLGFKRIGKGFDQDLLKRRYGNQLSIVPVRGGRAVLYRGRNGTVPVYKIQSSVEMPQRIDFYGAADRIGERYDVETISEGRQVSYE